MASQTFVTTETSYTLPAAECDLQLTAMQKGWLNAAQYTGSVVPICQYPMPGPGALVQHDLDLDLDLDLLGMLTTAFAWGALSDTLGRRRLMVGAFFALGVVEGLASMVTDFWGLFFARLVAGAL